MMGPGGLGPVLRGATGQGSSRLPLQGVLLGGQVRFWKSNPSHIPKIFLKPRVPLEKCRIEEPVSGSLGYEDMGKLRKFEWTAESMNAKGFLRYQKAYRPPPQCKPKLTELTLAVIPELRNAETKDIRQFKLTDPQIKFQLLSKAFSVFRHSVPNSMLYMMQTVGDVFKFYSTEIKTSTPFDDLVCRTDEDLPPNLHILKKAVRFHPETDTMFGGVTAFPKSSVIVTGLRSKREYKGFEAKKSWP